MQIINDKRSKEKSKKQELKLLCNFLERVAMAACINLGMVMRGRPECTCFLDFDKKIEAEMQQTKSF